MLCFSVPPLSVEIRLNNNYDFEAGQPRVVDCVVVGCVPPPSITWHLGDTMLRPNVHKVKRHLCLVEHSIIKYF